MGAFFMFFAKENWKSNCQLSPSQRSTQPIPASLLGAQERKDDADVREHRMPRILLALLDNHLVQACTNSKVLEGSVDQLFWLTGSESIQHGTTQSRERFTAVSGRRMALGVVSPYRGPELPLLSSQGGKSAPRGPAMRRINVSAKPRSPPRTAS